MAHPRVTRPLPAAEHTPGASRRRAIRVCASRTGRCFGHSRPGNRSVSTGGTSVRRGPDSGRRS